MMHTALLDIRDAYVSYDKRRFFSRVVTHFYALNAISLHIRPGESVGLVGESGSGKSTLGKVVAGLVPLARGSLTFRGQSFHGREFCHQPLRLRKEIQMVHQDFHGTLDPKMSIFGTIEEALVLHFPEHTRAWRKQRVEQLLEQVGLSPAMAFYYPRQLSGGQRQRVNIARALAVEPHLLICDEVVSALDVSVQAQILNLLSSIREQRALAMLFISHDMAVVERMCDFVCVLNAGKMVEKGTTEEVCYHPRDPYTQKLIQAVPDL
ncbi:MAG: ATP-binding cassette domain-containing protein [Puniceicoccales bacterium]|jgi:ABC-type glutathione transport system ATPase component|nr:ATP-binding cassette domain-containing protein [Puniceicoccales bacterium]